MLTTYHRVYVSTTKQLWHHYFTSQVTQSRIMLTRCHKSYVWTTKQLWNHYYFLTSQLTYSPTVLTRYHVFVCTTKRVWHVTTSQMTYSPTVLTKYHVNVSTTKQVWHVTTSQLTPYVLQDIALFESAQSRNTYNMVSPHSWHTMLTRYHNIYICTTMTSCYHLIADTQWWQDIIIFISAQPSNHDILLSPHSWHTMLTRYNIYICTTMTSCYHLTADTQCWQDIIIFISAQPWHPVITSQLTHNVDKTTQPTCLHKQEVMMSLHDPSHKNPLLILKWFKYGGTPPPPPTKTYKPHQQWEHK